MDEQLNTYLLDLLTDLDALAEDYSELGDTETRERMTEAVVLAFLKPQAGYSLPADLGLFSAEGNAAVRAALEKYIAHAGARAAAIGLSTPDERLAIFQAPVYTDEGNCGDEYFGWLDNLDA